MPRLFVSKCLLCLLDVYPRHGACTVVELRQSRGNKIKGKAFKIPYVSADARCLRVYAGAGEAVRSRCWALLRRSRKLLLDECLCIP